METSPRGGPKIQRDSTVVEESSKLWRYPVNLTRATDQPSQRSKEVGGAHIAMTTDSEGMP